MRSLQQRIANAQGWKLLYVLAIENISPKKRIYLIPFRWIELFVCANCWLAKTRSFVWSRSVNFQFSIKFCLGNAVRVQICSVTWIHTSDATDQRFAKVSCQIHAEFVKLKAENVCCSSSKLVLSNSSCEDLSGFEIISLNTFFVWMYYWMLLLWKFIPDKKFLLEP